MGSTRLPGKVMLSLDCTPVIQHVVRRTVSTDSIDTTVIATTQKNRDDIITRYSSKEGSRIFRGDEKDVLGRMWGAAKENNADLIVRITADNPLLSPEIIDSTIKKLKNTEADYISNKIDRSFPSGLDVEAFTSDSFKKVENQAENPSHREHVTSYYRNSNKFDLLNITADEVFTEKYMIDRTELRLTLDTPEDYELFSSVYDNVAYRETVNIRDAIQYIDQNGLEGINVE
jgi:spore coat polysaccharide biosynthesis protein SpsF